MADSVPPERYLEAHLSAWSAVVKKHNLKMDLVHAELGEGKGAYRQHIMSELCFDRSLDLAKMRSTGFQESSNLKRTWWTAFERFREAKGIP